MRFFLCLTLALFLNACNASTATDDLMRVGQGVLNGHVTSNASLGLITNADVVAAFKQALTIGTNEVTQQLGKTGGFNLDPKIHIPLPENLQKAQNILRSAGLGGMLNDLESRLNLAAEIATPHAKELFVNAIADMTFDDIMGVYNGADNSATHYFQGKMSKPLSVKMSPFVNNALAQAGAVRAYDNIMAQYKALPFVPDVKAELTNYVLDRGIDGLFYYIGEQEKAIRRDPVRQTTTLLKRVFGQRER